MGLKKTSLLLVLLLSPAIVFADGEDISPPWPWQIISDFGPRVVTSIVDFFHPGTDYAGPEGADIPAIEAGNVTNIGFSGGYFIAIKSLSRQWTYIHLFSDTTTISGAWELKQDVVLQKLGQQDEIGSVIVHWADIGRTHADKALSAFGGCQILANSSFILAVSGQPLLTQSSVTLHEAVGPVGRSGQAEGPHLHVRLDHLDQNPPKLRINPLYHLTHPSGVPVMTIESPIDGNVLTSTDLAKPYPIKVLVDSTSGLDMEQMSLFIYKNGDPGQSVALGTTAAPTFSYGGRPDTDRSDTIQLSAGDTTGIQPLDADPSTVPPVIEPGKDRFIFIQDLTALNLGAGIHKLVAKAKDVNNNASVDVSATF